jgi:hypothetical protein
MRNFIDVCGGIGIVWLEAFGEDGEEQWNWDL